MRRSKFSEDQINAILKEHESGTSVTELCQRYGISSATFYSWKANFGEFNVTESKYLRILTEENTRLKKLLADAILDNAMLKELLGKKL